MDIIVIVSCSSFISFINSELNESMYFITVVTSFLKARLNPRFLKVSRLYVLAFCGCIDPLKINRWQFGILWLYHRKWKPRLLKLRPLSWSSWSKKDETWNIYFLPKTSFPKDILKKRTWPVSSFFISTQKLLKTAKQIYWWRQ